jgi:hypothetical protein
VKIVNFLDIFRQSSIEDRESTFYMEKIMHMCKWVLPCLLVAGCKVSTNSDSAVRADENEKGSVRVGLTNIEVPNNVNVATLLDEVNLCQAQTDIGGKPYREIYGHGVTRDEIYAYHVKSAKNTFPSLDTENAKSVLSYVDGYVDATQVDLVTKAVKSTLEFLLPGFLPGHAGPDAVIPTINRKCNVFKNERVKAVHALGTVAKVKWKFREGLDFDTYFQAPIAGFLREKKELQAIVRFSIANPLVPNNSIDAILKAHGSDINKFIHLLKIQDKIDTSALLEFIPAIGMQVFTPYNVFGFVAMESLAGQGQNQNFFAHYFSPDFQTKAPDGYRTTDPTNPDLNNMMHDRYNQNPLNSHVMSLVAKRFKQAVKDSRKNLTEAQFNAPQTREGAHPFRIRTDGYLTNKKNVYRLLFQPVVADQAYNKNIKVA